MQLTKEEIKMLMASEDKQVERIGIKYGTATIQFDRAAESFRVNGSLSIQYRTGGKFGGKGLWLDPEFDWSLETDDLGQLVLVAKLK